MLTSNTFIRISGPITEVKKSALANEQIWFVPCGGLGGVATPEKFCRYWKKLWKQYFQHLN